jgi:hypothetical protein
VSPCFEAVTRLIAVSDRLCRDRYDASAYQLIYLRCPLIYFFKFSGGFVIAYRLLVFIIIFDTLALAL